MARKNIVYNNGVAAGGGLSDLDARIMAGTASQQEVEEKKSYAEVQRKLLEQQQEDERITQNNLKQAQIRNQASKNVETAERNKMTAAAVNQTNTNRDTKVLNEVGGSFWSNYVTGLKEAASTNGKTDKNIDRARNGVYYETLPDGKKRVLGDAEHLQHHKELLEQTEIARETGGGWAGSFIGGLGIGVTSGVLKTVLGLVDMYGDARKLVNDVSKDLLNGEFRKANRRGLYMASQVKDAFQTMKLALNDNALMRGMGGDEVVDEIAQGIKEDMAENHKYMDTELKDIVKEKNDENLRFAELEKGSYSYRSKEKEQYELMGGPMPEWMKKGETVYTKNGEYVNERYKAGRMFSDGSQFLKTHGPVSYMTEAADDRKLLAQEYNSKIGKEEASIIDSDISKSQFNNKVVQHKTSDGKILELPTDKLRDSVDPKKEKPGYFNIETLKKDENGIVQVDKKTGKPVYERKYGMNTAMASTLKLEVFLDPDWWLGEGNDATSTAISFALGGEFNAGALGKVGTLAKGATASEFSLLSSTMGKASAMETTIASLTAQGMDVAKATKLVTSTAKRATAVDRTVKIASNLSNNASEIADNGIQTEKDVFDELVTKNSKLDSAESVKYREERLARVGLTDPTSSDYSHMEEQIKNEQKASYVQNNPAIVTNIMAQAATARDISVGKGYMQVALSFNETAQFFKKKAGVSGIGGQPMNKIQKVLAHPIVKVTKSTLEEMGSEAMEETVGTYSDAFAKEAVLKGKYMGVEQFVQEKLLTKDGISAAVMGAVMGPAQKMAIGGAKLQAPGIINEMKEYNQNIKTLKRLQETPGSANTIKDFLGAFDAIGSEKERVERSKALKEMEANGDTHAVNAEVNRQFNDHLLKMATRGQSGRVEENLAKLKASTADPEHHAILDEAIARNKEVATIWDTHRALPSAASASTNKMNVLLHKQNIKDLDKHLQQGEKEYNEDVLEPKMRELNGNKPFELDQREALEKKAKEELEKDGNVAFLERQLIEKKKEKASTLVGLHEKMYNETISRPFINAVLNGEQKDAIRSVKKASTVKELLDITAELTKKGTTLSPKMHRAVAKRVNYLKAKGPVATSTTEDSDSDVDAETEEKLEGVVEDTSTEPAPVTVGKLQETRETPHTAQNVKDYKHAKDFYNRTKGNSEDKTVDVEKVSQELLDLPNSVPEATEKIQTTAFFQGLHPEERKAVLKRIKRMGVESVVMNTVNSLKSHAEMDVQTTQSTKETLHKEIHESNPEQLQEDPSGINETQLTQQEKEKVQKDTIESEGKLEVEDKSDLDEQLDKQDNAEEITVGRETIAVIDEEAAQKLAEQASKAEQDAIKNNKKNKQPKSEQERLAYAAKKIQEKRKEKQVTKESKPENPVVAVTEENETADDPMYFNTVLDEEDETAKEIDEVVKDFSESYELSNEVAPTFENFVDTLIASLGQKDVADNYADFRDSWKRLHPETTDASLEEIYKKKFGVANAVNSLKTLLQKKKEAARKAEEQDEQVERNPAESQTERDERQEAPKSSDKKESIKTSVTQAVEVKSDAPVTSEAEDFTDEDMFEVEGAAVGKELREEDSPNKKTVVANPRLSVATEERVKGPKGGMINAKRDGRGKLNQFVSHRLRSSARNLYNNLHNYLNPKIMKAGQKLTAVSYDPFEKGLTWKDIPFVYYDESGARHSDKNDPIHNFEDFLFKKVGLNEEQIKKVKPSDPEFLTFFRSLTPNQQDLIIDNIPISFTANAKDGKDYFIGAVFNTVNWNNSRNLTHPSKDRAATGRLIRQARENTRRIRKMVVLKTHPSDKFVITETPLVNPVKAGVYDEDNNFTAQEYSLSHSDPNPSVIGVYTGNSADGKDLVFHKDGEHAKSFADLYPDSILDEESMQKFMDIKKNRNGIAVKLIFKGMRVDSNGQEKKVYALTYLSNNKNLEAGKKMNKSANNLKDTFRYFYAKKHLADAQEAGYTAEEAYNSMHKSVQKAYDMLKDSDAQMQELKGELEKQGVNFASMIETENGFTENASIKNYLQRYPDASGKLSYTLPSSKGWGMLEVDMTDGNVTFKEYKSANSQREGYQAFAEDVLSNVNMAYAIDDETGGGESMTVFTPNPHIQIDAVDVQESDEIANIRAAKIAEAAERQRQAVLLIEAQKKKSTSPETETKTATENTPIFDKNPRIAELQKQKLEIEKERDAELSLLDPTSEEYISKLSEYQARIFSNETMTSRTRTEISESEKDVKQNKETAKNNTPIQEQAKPVPVEQTPLTEDAIEKMIAEQMANKVRYIDENNENC